MKRMWLLVVFGLMVLVGCGPKVPVFGPIVPTAVIVVGDITPVTLGSDGGGYERGWRIPAPQYKELALEFRESLIEELQHSLIVLQVKGEPAPLAPELSDNPAQPIVFENLHFLYFPPSAIRWMGVIGFSAQIYQNGKKVSEFFDARPTSVLVAAVMHKQLAAERFVGRLKKLLPPTAAVSATR